MYLCRCIHKESVFKGCSLNHSYQISFFWEKEKPPKFSFAEFGYTDLHLWRQIFNANALKFNSNGILFCLFILYVRDGPIKNKTLSCVFFCSSDLFTIVNCVVVATSFSFWVLLHKDLIVHKVKSVFVFLIIFSIHRSKLPFIFCHEYPPGNHQ